MIFSRNRPVASNTEQVGSGLSSHPVMLAAAPADVVADHAFVDDLKRRVAPLDVELGSAEEVTSKVSATTPVLSIFQGPEEQTLLLRRVIASRAEKSNGFPVLIIATKPECLKELGAWLYRSAVADELQGVRLIVSSDVDGVSAQLGDKLEPICEPNIIKMAVSPETEDTDYKYFYTLSPSLRRATNLIEQFAENGVTRIYLLGGPGAGKTSLAYLYWLRRNRGRFITVNLTAESTDDKAAMKSLLCGHVVGAFPGSQSREGALSFAEDGVAFLDESHGVSGVVMQVLMEVLDSGQYLPYGGTKKRRLRCAVIFASNRNWETLRSLIHPDEHARLGATVVALSDLSEREEDLIAVLATTLSRFSGQCKSWAPPSGLTSEAWSMIRACRWRGNVRTLVRVTESAAISYCTDGSSSGLVEAAHVREGLSLWEPEEESARSERLYASFS